MIVHSLSTLTAQLTQPSRLSDVCLEAKIAGSLTDYICNLAEHLRSNESLSLKYISSKNISRKNQHSQHQRHPHKVGVRTAVLKYLRMNAAAYISLFSLSLSLSLQPLSHQIYYESTFILYSLVSDKLVFIIGSHREDEHTRHLSPSQPPVQLHIQTRKQLRSHDNHMIIISDYSHHPPVLLTLAPLDQRKLAHGTPPAV